LALHPGTRLGVYEVTASIGEGGMGAVYRATDTSLGRQVAIKVLPDAFAQDADRLARFEREAKTLAALNHPNIAAVYGFETSGTAHALVMELVEGEDLSRRLARGAMPLDEVLPIAKQIAEALEAAHEQRIVHRDLKPANIKVKADGTVKVLDFGLAKALAPEGAGATADAMSSPTMTAHATQLGMILGTAAYMAPEQARGKAVDRRADVWAFGTVVYEMLTGTRAFPGDDITDTLAAVVRAEPDWSLIPKGLSPTLRVFLRRCLEKDPKQRIGDIHDVRLALDGAFDTTTSQTTSPAASWRRARLAWTAFAVAVLGMIALAIPAVRHLREAPPAPLETRVDIVTPGALNSGSFALSPDGRLIVFTASADSRLWLRNLASDTAQPLSGTEGASLPFWSPDSRSLGFFAEDKLKRLDLGGVPQTLAPIVRARGGTWNAEGIILFAPDGQGPLFRIAASGGQAVAVTTGNPQPHYRYPSFLPDGRQFVFLEYGSASGSGIYLGSLDSGETTLLTAGGLRGLYLSPGWLLWVRGQALVAQRLDLARKALTGQAITLADPVGADSIGAIAASVSADGLVAYRAGVADPRQLTWFDRTGKVSGVAGGVDPEAPLSPEISPDGRRVALDRTVRGNRDVWLMDLARDGLTRFTFDAALDGFPVWSPDGSRIVFESKRKGGSWDLWIKPSSGAGTEDLLLETPNDEWPYDWSKDGRFLLYHVTDPKTGGDLWALPMMGADRKPIAVATTPFTEHNGQFSPDGRLVAYETNESDRFEIVVQTFPDPVGKWQLSTAGGRQPRWRADGKELYFLAPDSTMMAVTVAASGTTLEAGKPVALFPTNLAWGQDKAQYAVARDGRFLFNQTTETTAPPVTLIQHWNPQAKK
jgi:Tol biopolymer transport system component